MTTATLTTDSPLAGLKLPSGLAKELDRVGYKTIGSLSMHTAAYFLDRRFAARDIAAMTEALAKHGFEFAKPISSWNRCGACPTCETCGNPRAQTAASVVVGLDGRAKHHGGTAGPVCDGCNTHHRELVAGRALELAGRLA